MDPLTPLFSDAPQQPQRPPQTPPARQQPQPQQTQPPASPPDGAPSLEGYGAEQSGALAEASINDLTLMNQLQRIIQQKIQPGARKTHFTDAQIIHALTNSIAVMPDPQVYSRHVVLGYADSGRTQPIQLAVGKPGSRRPLEITGAMRPFDEKYLAAYRDDEQAFCAAHGVEPRPMPSMREIRRGIAPYPTPPQGYRDKTLIDFIQDMRRTEAAATGATPKPVTHRRAPRPNRNGPVTTTRMANAPAPRTGDDRQLG